MITLLGSRGALSIGGVLALLSLGLSMEFDFFRGPRGYQAITEWSAAWSRIAAGKIAWPAVFLEQVQGAVYPLGLILAALALGGVLPGRLGRTIRGNRMLVTLAGAIALLGVSGPAGGWVLLPGNYPAGKLTLPLLILTWAAPITLWLVRARSEGENWNRTRVAVLVFYLPLFFLSFSFLPVLTYFAMGFGAFLAGMLLVWWGFIQGRRQIAVE